MPGASRALSDNKRNKKITPTRGRRLAFPAIQITPMTLSADGWVSGWMWDGGVKNIHPYGSTLSYRSFISPSPSPEEKVKKINKCAILNHVRLECTKVP